MIWAAVIAALLLLAMVSGPRRPRASGPRADAPAPPRKEPLLAEGRAPPAFKTQPPPPDVLASASAPAAPSIGMLSGDGSYSFEIVGDGHHQAALEALAGGRSMNGIEVLWIAHLVPEPANAFDYNAVRVEIDGNLVGYLSRQDAIVYHGAFARVSIAERVFACRAMIKGGWDRGPDDRGDFSVDLDLEWPPRPET